ncbi:D-glycero-alpha-D-manno-heptose-1,7-bisphosphate 7-phosphatase [Nanoarchaeota archaeon]
MARAIFLDRDGVVCEDTNMFYQGTPLLKPEDFKWIPGSKEALKLLSNLEFKVALVTNQSIINKGLLSEEEFLKTNNSLYGEMSKNNINIERIYYCKHTPKENCECRKPKIGLLIQAEKELGVSLKDCYVIGDKTSDIKMGEDAGCKTILVKTGYGGRDDSFEVNPDFIMDNLYEAIKILK